MWYAIVLFLLVLIIISFSRDREKMLVKQVDTKGGMRNKYQVLINLLIGSRKPDMNISRDSITIKLLSENTIYYITITETFNKVHVKWVGKLSIFGTHKKEWNYPHNYSQEIIYSELVNHIEWVTENLIK